MKKLLLSVAIATTLFSCSENDKAVKLDNGAIVRASVPNDIPYLVGAKVCVRRWRGEWQICTDGEMKDTTIASSVHRIGYVLSQLHN